MKIRIANVEDIKQIINLCGKLMDYLLQFDDYYRLRFSSDDEFINYFKNLIISKDSRVLVAEDNGIIVGFLIGKIESRPPFFEVEKRGFIGCTYVQTQYRKQGVGKRLTNKILRWFKDKGIEYVELSVDYKNDLGHNVWKSLGFETWHLKMKKRI